MIIANPMAMTAWNYSIEDALRLYARLGYDALEVCRPDVETCKTDAMRRQFAEYASSLGLPLIRYNVAAADYFGPLESKEDSKAVVEGLKHDIDVAAGLGASQMITWEGRAPAGATAEDVHGWILEETVTLFREALDYAKPKGISISVEVHPFTLGIDLDFMVKLCDRLDPEYFGVTYDCSHFAVGLPDGYIDAILTLGSRIKHLHFCDGDKCSSEVHFPPGKGCLDLQGIVDALKRVRFNGTFMADMWLYPLPEEAARISVPYMRRIIEQLKTDV